MVTAFQGTAMARKPIPMDRLVAVSRISYPRSSSSGRKRNDSASINSIRTNTGTAYRIALTMSVSPLLGRRQRRDAPREQVPRQPFGVVGPAIGDELGQLDVAAGVEQFVGAVRRRYRR